eukprot:COSAG01_NODE_32629_length_578_cov_0.822547_2_plen_115_part_01
MVILGEALAYLETQQLRTVAVWGAHVVDDLFVSTLGTWLNGAASAIKQDDGIIPPKVCDVTKFGAKGDNRTKDTAALKAAITACSGGGTVLLRAPGKYLTAPFNLSSHQVLRIEK